MTMCEVFLTFFWWLPYSEGHFEWYFDETEIFKSIRFILLLWSDQTLNIGDSVMTGYLTFDIVKMNKLRNSQHRLFSSTLPIPFFKRFKMTKFLQMKIIIWWTITQDKNYRILAVLHFHFHSSIEPSSMGKQFCALII